MMLDEPLSRRNFLAKSTTGLVVGTVAATGYKGREEDSLRKKVKENTGQNPLQDPETRKELSQIARSNSMVTVALPAAALSAQSVSRALDGIESQPTNHVPGDSALNRLASYHHHHRRSFLQSLAGMGVTAGLAGPLLANIFGKDLKHYLEIRKNNSGEILKPKQVVDAFSQQSEDYRNDAGFYGASSALARGVLGYCGQINNDFLFLRFIKLIDDSRKKILESGKAEIKGYLEMPGVYKPFLVDFIPIEFLELGEPIMLTLQQYDDSGVQVAYFSESEGDTENWTGPGIYYRDIHGRRQSDKKELLMPRQSFSIEINNFKELKEKLLAKTALSVA